MGLWGRESGKHVDAQRAKRDKVLAGDWLRSYPHQNSDHRALGRDDFSFAHVSDLCTANHAKPIRVFSQDGVTVFAGSASRTKWETPDPRPSGEGVVFDLAGVWKHDRVLDLGEGFPFPMIRLEWSDFSTPKIGRKEWDLIVERVRFHKGATVACMGGHGRTGTALAILGVLLGAISENANPVEFVRHIYCKKAVETAGQMQYVRDMTGRLCASKGSKA
jgi:hypothetical protein